jgi:hypothetical protein
VIIHAQEVGLSSAALELGMPASALETKIRLLKIDKHRSKAA